MLPVEKSSDSSSANMAANPQKTGIPPLLLTDLGSVGQC
jgi:hypothetical protein